MLVDLNLNTSMNSTIPEGNVTCPKRMIASMPTARLIIGHYIFPWLLIIGVTGNILNLLVLNGRGMRTKTNALLSAMAVADICFFLVIIPTELRVFETVSTKDWYRSFLAHHTMTMTVSSNWFATASTWMALAVTAERVFAIKMPLHAKFYWKNARVAILITTVFICSLLIHVYNLFWFRTVSIPINCSNGTIAYIEYQLHPINNQGPVFTYVKTSHIFVPHLAITLPFFILLILNSFLLFYLHKNRRAMAEATTAPQLRQNELKVALMVATIVVTFIICATPSVALYLYDAVITFALRLNPYTPTFFNISALSNCLVVTGKASNFILYCSASSHFRRRLARLFCKRYGMPNPASSRASTSQRRTTLTSLLTAAFAELQFNHHTPQDQSHKRGSAGNTCCVLAPATCPSTHRRLSTKSGDSTIENLIELKMPTLTPVERSNKTMLSQGMKANGKRRNSSQH